MKKDMAWIHPRKRIADVLQDGMHVEVLLKDRKRQQTEEEREWYDYAFGKYRNMMEVISSFIPVDDDGGKRYFFRIEYQIFKEMCDEQFGEFDPEDYPEQQDHEMEENEDDDGNLFWKVSIMLPYGHIESKKIFWQWKEPPEGEDNELKEFDDKAYKFAHFPAEEVNPVSLENLRQENAEEEAKNKEVERAKRAEQKERLEREKRELAEQ